MASGSETKGMKAFGDQLWYRAPDDLPAGKISIPSISSYTFILISYVFTSGEVAYCSIYRYSNGSTFSLNVFQLDPSQNSIINAINSCTRYGTFLSDGIQFTSGYMTWSGNLYKDWDGRCIPIEVRGI